MSTIDQSADLDASGSVSRSEAPAKIKLNNVNRTFGSFTAVDDINLEIKDGEFVVLLGPSGCGKSTLLRMIAGLQPVSSGTIELLGKEVQDSEPDERDLAFVFQNYALYPHMSVRRNMTFPLLMRQFRWWDHIPGLGWWRRRRFEKSPQVVDRVNATAQALGLEKLMNRIPATLSGGQRQRVALARAMVREPLAFLMDEPLSNLDAKLRAQTRDELRRFHRMLKATIVYVTHDQVEATTMGDKIGVMLDGQLQQFGTPREVYENPANTFVAQFIGTPAMSLLPASESNGQWSVVDQSIDASHGLVDTTRRATEDSGSFLLGIRSEFVSLADASAPGALRGTVTSVEDWGSEQLISVGIGAGTISEEEGVEAFENVIDVRVPPRVVVDVGDVVGLALDIDSVHVFDAVSGDSLTPINAPVG